MINYSAPYDRDDIDCYQTTDLKRQWPGLWDIYHFSSFIIFALYSSRTTVNERNLSEKHMTAAVIKLTNLLNPVQLCIIV